MELGYIFQEWIKYRQRLYVLLFLLVTCFVLPVKADESAVTRTLLQNAGFKGGFIVHVGCGNGSLTTELQRQGKCLVHGLDANAAAIKTTQQSLQSAKEDNEVIFDAFDGVALPYVDNMVNLLVVSKRYSLTDKEMLRVLCPEGTACVKQDNGWITIRKPTPEGMADWTHLSSDSTGNIVGKDRLIGPPRHMQWTGGQLYARSHEHPSSFVAAVTCKGRIFSIEDHAPLDHAMLPPQWVIVARDAFNGIVLWKRTLDTWHSHLFQRSMGPYQMQRRMVAAGDRIYVTLGLYEPLSVLDAATGKLLKTFENTKYVEEILAAGDTLTLLINRSDKKEPLWDYLSGFGVLKGVPAKKRVHVNKNYRQSPGYVARVEGKRSVIGFDPEAGKILWEREFPEVTTTTMVCDEQSVYLHAEKKVHCLDRRNGTTRWSVDASPKQKKLQYVNTPYLQVVGDQLFFSNLDGVKAISTKDGTELWSQQIKVPVFYSMALCFVIRDLVWIIEGNAYERNYWSRGDNPGGNFIAFDRLTGEKRKEIRVPVEKGMGITHHRCYPTKASGDYILTGWPGTEFTDTRTGEVFTHNWVRGSCQAGILPANGLLYAPPTVCSCYPDALLSGFNALAPASQRSAMSEPAARLETGPAYRKEGEAQPPSAEAWPTFRGDNRSGGTVQTTLPDTLDEAWKVQLGKDLTQPICVAGMLFVASKQEKTVYALDAKTGSTRWAFKPSGVVDSPPSYHNGRVIFGCRNGYVYSLDADTGALAWRFLAAPEINA